MTAFSNQPERHGMTAEQAKALVKKYGTITAAAEAAGIPRTTLRDRLPGIARDASPTEGKAATRKLRTISERDLLMETDSETRFRLNLRRLVRSFKRGEYMRDFDMRRETGASGDAALWREVRGEEEFAGNIMEIGHGSEPALYWGHRDSVADMIQRGKARRPVWLKGKKP
jgi:hypothetical protein